MSKRFFFIGFLCSCLSSNAQKIENIYFNLYTDSLKKGFYNYINVDGKTTDERWLPLDSTTLILTTTGGTFKGNNLFIDSSYTKETVKIKAVLRSNPAIWKEEVIYIRKRGFDEPLKSSEELLEDMKKQKVKIKKKD